MIFALSPEDAPKESQPSTGGTIAETVPPVQSPSASPGASLPSPADIGAETEYADQDGFTPPTADIPMSTYERILSQFDALGRLDRADYVRLWSNQSAFRIGDVISYSFESRKTCYLVLLNLTSDGELVQIFPNRFHPSAFVKANETYHIPGEGAEISLEVTGPAGTDRLIALTSEMPFDIFSVDFERQAFALLDRSSSGQEDVLRNMEALANGGVSQLTYSYTIR
jgi:hypothetical protein